MLFDLNSMLSQPMWIAHESICYYGEVKVDHCDMLNKKYKRDVDGAVYIAPNINGIYRPLFLIGPEYIKENSVCINTIENILTTLNSLGFKYEL